MKLRLKNVGKFLTETEIELDGITVLAGENGTGKSTIGKALYCIFDVFYKYDEKIKNARARSIFRELRNVVGAEYLINRQYDSITSEIKKLIDQYPALNVDQLLNSFLKNNKEPIDKHDYETFVDKTKEVLEASEKSVLEAIFRREIESEFRAQIGHVNYPLLPSEIELTVKGNVIKVYMNKDLDINIDSVVRLVKEIIYIDDPNSLGSLDRIYFRENEHTIGLKDKINGRRKTDFSAVDDVIAEKKLKRLYEKINAVCSGEITRNDEKGMVYSDSRLKEGIDISNLSTGIKSFAIIKALLQKGYLEENGMIILDEPEAHLHPEWMQIYAEIIVMLQDLLGVNFLISTHSADFLSFIELYTRKYDVSSKTNFYMLSRDSENDLISTITDVTGDLKSIYAKLSFPFLRASEELDGMNEANK